METWWTIKCRFTWRHVVSCFSLAMAAACLSQSVAQEGLDELGQRLAQSAVLVALHARLREVR
jgi:hypothetical protein